MCTGNVVTICLPELQRDSIIIRNQASHLQTICIPPDLRIQQLTCHKSLIFTQIFYYNHSVPLLIWSFIIILSKTELSKACKSYIVDCLQHVKHHWTQQYTVSNSLESNAGWLLRLVAEAIASIKHSSEL